MNNISNDPLFNDDDNSDDKEEEKKRSLHDITKELIDQLKNSSSDLIMSLPLEDEEIVTNAAKGKTTKDSVIEHIKSFNIKPKDIKKYLDRFVISQDTAKKALSIAICDHYNYIKEAIEKKTTSNYTKQNVLMIGPTGVGKTYMVKRIAELIGVPFIKSDATKFTETGYQGGDIEDLVRQLYKKADNNMQLAEFGIIYLDEIDKITTASSHHHKDVSGRGVQSNLLKIMEDTDVPIRPSWDIQSQIKQMMGNKQSSNEEKETINTKNILFIMSGAFNNLDEIIKKRLDGATIGFERNQLANDNTLLFEKLRTKDLIDFGLEPEFSGRLPVRVHLKNLEIDDLYDILTHSEDSILEQYTNSFLRYGIELVFSDCALKEIATLAYEEKIGGRALSSILEKVFRDFKFELPSTTINFLFADEEFIKDPSTALKKHLDNPEQELLNDIEKTVYSELKQLKVSPTDRRRIIKNCHTNHLKGNILELIKTEIQQLTNKDVPITE